MVLDRPYPLWGWGIDQHYCLRARSSWKSPENSERNGALLAGWFCDRHGYCLAMCPMSSDHHVQEPT